MKGKFLLLVLCACVPISVFGQASSSSSASSSQASSSSTPALPDAPRPAGHFDVYAGVAYSSANQVKSSSALFGGTVAVDGKLKPWFGGTVDFGYYGFGYGTVKPTMYTMLAGPSFFIPSDKFEGFFHVLFGLAHTGGVSATPNLAYAYAIGGGMQYDIRRNLALRAAGDGIFSAFALDPNNLGYSQNMRVNPRATFGVVYHF
uniref:Outer membrane protein beta-barrel domain-containing protein n=1 Tax=mine drainage metagenome TaxID=410659 RepID=E6QIY3_9ZZZZ